MRIVAITMKKRLYPRNRREKYFELGLRRVKVRALSSILRTVRFKPKDIYGAVTFCHVEALVIAVDA